MFNISNPWRRAREAELTATNLSAELTIALTSEQSAIVDSMRCRRSLRNIVAAASSVNSPNGTTRKILRMAESAL